MMVPAGTSSRAAKATPSVPSALKATNIRLPALSCAWAGSIILIQAVSARIVFLIVYVFDTKLQRRIADYPKFKNK